MAGAAREGLGHFEYHDTHAMTDFSTCQRHGMARHAIVCSHFFDGTPATAHFLPAMGDEPLQIWCAQCEAARVQDQGWYDAADAVAGWVLTCPACAQDMLAAARTVIEAHDEPTPEQRPGV